MFVISTTKTNNTDTWKHKFQIFRVVSTAHVGTGTAPSYLIPVRIEGLGTVWDTSTSEVTLKVGQRVYFDKPIIVEEGLDFLLIPTPDPGVPEH